MKVLPDCISPKCISLTMYVHQENHQIFHLTSWPWFYLNISQTSQICMQINRQILRRYQSLLSCPRSLSPLSTIYVERSVSTATTLQISPTQVSCALLRIYKYQVS